MVTSFVPIGLFVLAGFTLGVIVGRLAWASSQSGTRSGTMGKSFGSEVKNLARRGLAPMAFSPPVDPSDQELPVWRMREIEAPPGQLGTWSWFDADSSTARR
ncbi:MAG: hypothetical protein OEZ14_11715 [Acidimicrobiia bacterium]|nr:hypothetical protein [Acidimicrobiia bacterium]MDH5521185.1 hypothetical protein [Acidimicrobiia bacterium]